MLSILALIETQFMGELKDKSWLKKITPRSFAVVQEAKEVSYLFVCFMFKELKIT